MVAAGEVRDGEGLVQPVQGPGAHGGHPVPARRQGTLQELRLASLAVRRHDQTPRDPDCGLGAVVGAYEVEAEVDARRESGAGRDSSVIDVQQVRIHVDRRVPGRRAGRSPAR